MAAMAENRMNLAALQQRDPYITGIVDTASQVALYSFNTQSSEWEKTEVEGTLFVYTRSASPINGFMILNRLGLNDMIEPINKNLEFQLQDPFLLYRNGQASICGIWFYDKDECARIGQLMNSLVHIAIDSQEQQSSTLSQTRRERRASESEIRLEGIPKSSTGITGGDEGAAGGDMGINGMVVGDMNVNIVQMLTKAQDEYEQVNPGAKVPGKRSAPKPMIDNPNAAATKSTNIIKPLALKPAGNQSDSEDKEPDTPSSTHINLDTLFKQAGAGGGDKHPQSAQVMPSNQMPPLLQRLMSQPGSYLEDIERNHRSEKLHDELPKTAGAEASTHLTNGAAVPKLASPPKTVQAVWNDSEPESPNTALRRTLNLLPSSSSSPSQLFNLDKNNSKNLPGQFSVENNRTSPGFPGLRRNFSGSNSETVSHNNKSDHKTSKDTYNSQSLQRSSLFASSGGIQSDQITPPQQAPQKSGYLQPQKQPLAKNQSPSSLMSGINPLCSDAVQSQLKQLSISDNKVFSVTGKHTPTKDSKSDKVTDWLSSTSPLRNTTLMTPQALVGGGGGGGSVGAMPHVSVGTSSSGPGCSMVNTAPRSLSSVSSQVSASPHQVSGSGSVLLTPMAFETARVTPPGSGNIHQSVPVQCLVDSDSASQKSTSPLSVEKPSKHLENAADINPLTKEQLQQALVHMLKNDPAFLSSIHEAYVKSLQLSIRTERK